MKISELESAIFRAVFYARRVSVEKARLRNEESLQEL